MLTAGLALAAYGIVQTDDWGWASSRFAVCEIVSAGLIVLFVRRSRIVSNPVLDLTLFESQSFRWATAMLIYAIGFSAMFLGNVCSSRGLALLDPAGGHGDLVGPLIVAVTAPCSANWQGVGQRRLLIPGGLIWASSGRC
jgi:hypothetical protein